MANRTSVFLNVNNVEKSSHFYEGLGFKAKELNTNERTGELTMASLSLGGAELWIGAISSNPDPEFQSWMRSGPVGVGVLPTFGVPNVDAIHEKARRIGAEIEQPPTDEDDFGRFLMVTDPDGYSISFWQEPRSARRAPARRAAKRKAPSRARAATRAAGKRRAKR